MDKINIFTGPMKCGKTKKLIDEYNKLKYCSKRIQMFKPCIDDRFTVDKVTTRDGDSVSCININSISDLYLYKDTVDIFFIDEFQFLNGSIDTIIELENIGKIFFISGLNLTSEKKPFGIMNNLFCIADKITILKSICENCKQYEAKYTICNIEKTKDIIVGDGIYSPVCNECYMKISDSN